MSVLGKILKTSKGLSASDVFKMGTKRLGSQGNKSNKQLKDFEDFLNGTYNLTMQSMPKNNDINNNLTTKLQKSLLDATNRLDSSKILSSYNNEVNYKPIGLLNHTQRIKADTIARRIKQIAELVGKTNIDNDDAEAAILEWNKALTELKDLANLEYNEKGQITAANNDVVDKKAIGQFDKAYKVLLETIVLPLKSNKKLGEAFEEFLVQTVADSIGGQIQESVQRMGQDLVNRGSLQQIYTNKEEQDEWEKAYKTEDDENVKLSAAFDPKYGKTDVNINIKLGKVPSNFRVSAKNWSRYEGHDFGETLLQYALERTVNLEATLGYGVGLAITPAEDISNQNRYHDYAKACVFLDIVMGYSQEQNYADTIVILDRSNPKRPIKVYSIQALIDKYQNNFEKLRKSISGYQDEQVYSKLVKAIEGSALERQPYASKILGELHQIKVGVMSSVLNQIK